MHRSAPGRWMLTWLAEPWTTLWASICTHARQRSASGCLPGSTRPGLPRGLQHLSAAVAQAAGCLICRCWHRDTAVRTICLLFVGGNMGVGARVWVPRCGCGCAGVGVGVMTMYEDASAVCLVHDMQGCPLMRVIAGHGKLYRRSSFLFSDVSHALSAQHPHPAYPHRQSAASTCRVQSVALRLCCEREVEASKFVPEEYWSISAQFGLPGNKVGHVISSRHFSSPPTIDRTVYDTAQAVSAMLSRADGKKMGGMAIKDQQQAQSLTARIKAASFQVGALQNLFKRSIFLASAASAVPNSRKNVYELILDLAMMVSDTQSKLQQRQPAAPFITSTLQQEASRRLGFGASRTMQAAQALYEGSEAGEQAMGLRIEKALWLARMEVAFITSACLVVLDNLENRQTCCSISDLFFREEIAEF
eukprot:1159126-Pelagomonas_calceolata.AAC.11